MPCHCSKPAAPYFHAAPLTACALLAASLLLACPLLAATAAEPDGSTGESYGTGPQITDDGRLFAWLYLPELPNRPELETLRVERAWADNPHAWEPLYTFVWNEGWAEFAALEDPFQTIRYYNYDTGEDVPFVDYFETECSGRSFYLRAYADIVADGKTATRSFAPVFFVVPDDGKPDGPPSDAGDGGGSGGDKGGIGQGEHERPVIETPSFLPSERYGENAGAHAGEEAETEASAEPDASSERSESNGSSNRGSEGASDADDAQEDASSAILSARPLEGNAAQPTEAGDRQSTPSEREAASRLPGALVALAVAMALVCLAGIILRKDARRG